MPLLDAECGYQAILTHDPRFNGVFFVGVTTTRIYCRNVSRAKTPQRKNCAFYPSAAAAEQAGFRPWLLCRPELAPGNARSMPPDD
jgi:AraC family transcriptional regulator, regulatory protein of adaptative response / DNA-3-methyladenine glycosylase II